MLETAKSAEQDKTEYGVWFEMCRQLVEACGIEWRGRKGWDWEWFVNPGFLMAYTPEERERIIDETFRLFRQRFGTFPRVAGSWLLDAHSMDYMNRKYESRILIDFGVLAEESWATAQLKFRGGGEFFKKLDFPPGEVRMAFDGCQYGIGYEGDLKPSQNGWTLYPIHGKGALQF